MAVAFDAVGPSSSGFSSTTTFTSGSWTHPGAAGMNALLVGLAFDINQGSVTPVTVTAGGTSMTALASAVISGTGQAALQYVFGLNNPPAGSITISWTATFTGSAVCDGVIGFSQSWTGAGGGFGTAVTATGTSASNTATDAGTAASSRVAAFNQNGDGFTQSGQPASPFNPANGTNNLFGGGGGSGGNYLCADAAAGGSITYSYNTTVGTDTWGVVLVEVLAPSSSSPSYQVPIFQPRLRSKRKNLAPQDFRAQPPVTAAGVPRAFRSSPFRPRANRGVTAYPPARGGVSQPPIPPTAVHDQRKPGQRDGTGSPPSRGSSPSWTKGISQPPIPPTSVRDTRKPPRIPRSAETPYPGGISQPPIPPVGLRDVRRFFRIPRSVDAPVHQTPESPVPPQSLRDTRKPPRIPRSAATPYPGGISQPPIPPVSIRNVRRFFRIPRSAPTVVPPSTVVAPAVPLPSSQHASRRIVRLPWKGSTAIKIAGGISQPPIPPQGLRDTRKPPRIPRSVAAWTQGVSQPPIPPTAIRNVRRFFRIPRSQISPAPPSTVITPAVPLPSSKRAEPRRLRLPDRGGSIFPTKGGVSQPPIPPTSIRDQRRSPRIPRSTASWFRGVSQPPIPPTGVRPIRHVPWRRVSGYATPPVPAPPAIPVPQSVSIPRRVFLFLLRRVRPLPPPSPTTFIILPGDVDVTDSKINAVSITNARAQGVALSDSKAQSVIITNGAVGGVTISDSKAQSVQIGNELP